MGRCIKIDACAERSCTLDDKTTESLTSGKLETSSIAHDGMTEKKMATYENPRQSPLSDIPSENGANTMEKALIKRNIMIKNHTSNFRAGYVPVHEQDLHKTGLRGRKTYAFWTLVLLLLLLAAGNLILTFTVLGVLRLGQGMESLEFLPKESLIKFYGRTDLDEVIKRDGLLEGFRGSPVSITSEDSASIITLLRHKEPENGPRITVEPDGRTDISNVLGFEIHDQVGKSVFSTAYPNFGLPSKVSRLDVQAARVRRVASPVGSGLLIGSENYITLRGNEGTRVEGREIVWSADQDLWLRSVNGSIILSSSQGVALDVQNLPLASTSAVTPQFRLCVCRAKGRLFKVKLPATCLGYASSPDPCA